MTGSRPQYAPHIIGPQVQRVVHAAGPYVFESGDAPGVDAHQHFDRAIRAWRPR
jgi:hypothetical protein